MASFSTDLKMPVSEVFSEIQHCIGTADYKVKTIVPNQSVIAEGNRDFSWAIVIILAILLWPAAIVYYFTRQRSSITATINKNSEDECNVTITSNGNTGDDLMRLIQNVFQKGKSEDISHLEERYAKGEITTEEFESKKEKVNAEQIETHIEILKERYAKGEITTEEFEKMKKDLENS